MTKFTFKKDINQHGKDMIEAYETYLNPNTLPYIKTAIETALLKEKSLKVRSAVANKVSLNKFIEIVGDQQQYLTGFAEEQSAAIEFVECVIPANAKVHLDKSGRTKIVIQKRIGLKSTDFQKYFGTTTEETAMLYDTGFTRTFVQLRVRKKIMDVVGDLKPKGYEIVVEDAQKVSERKMFNICVNFKISIAQLDTKMCNEIMSLIKKLEENCAEFTC